jgi:hypothetical protein|tara:strand:- start:102 stop:437 length:336 start_codon:yes stop_codon:yes gene_type:complete
VTCFIGVIFIIIVWSASGFFLLVFVGWLGEARRLYWNEKLLGPLNRWIDKTFPVMRFKNYKPIFENLPNLLYNIIVAFPLRFILTSPLSILLMAAMFGLIFVALSLGSTCS